MVEMKKKREKKRSVEMNEWMSERGEEEVAELKSNWKQEKNSSRRVDEEKFKDHAQHKKSKHICN